MPGRGASRMEQSSTHEPPPVDTLADCEFVDQLRIANALHGQVIIRSENGSEVALDGYQGFHVGALGECSTKARVAMAETARWKVPRVTGRNAIGRFARDIEVKVGKAFAMLFYYPEANRP